MEPVRMVSYAAGALMSLVLAGQLVRIRHTLARLMAVAMGAWAVNCVILLLLLYFLTSSGQFPLWRDLATTINALLLAIVPAALYAWFLRENGING